jgi:hypothetical protein
VRKKNNFACIRLDKRSTQLFVVALILFYQRTSGRQEHDIIGGYLPDVFSNPKAYTSIFEKLLGRVSQETIACISRVRDKNNGLIFELLHTCIEVLEAAFDYGR